MALMNQRGLANLQRWATRSQELESRGVSAPQASLLAQMENQRQDYGDNNQLTRQRLSWQPPSLGGTYNAQQRHGGIPSQQTIPHRTGGPSLMTMPHRTGGTSHMTMPDPTLRENNQQFGLPSGPQNKSLPTPGLMGQTAYNVGTTRPMSSAPVGGPTAPTVPPVHAPQQPRYQPLQGGRPSPYGNGPGPLRVTPVHSPGGPRVVPNQPTNSTPTSTPTNTPATDVPSGRPPLNPGGLIDASTVPGARDSTGLDEYNDHYNWGLSALGDRDAGEFGGREGIGGNSVDNRGNWRVPDFLRDLVADYNRGANTDATTRQVSGDETVEGRLAGLMSRDNPLNRYAMDDARAEAAARGMLGSSVAAGAALRASRQAMLPIAQQDAAWYGQTARDNMDALNQDAMADQQQRAGLMGQTAGINAQLFDNATDRRFRADEANTERAFRTYTDELNFRRGNIDREDQQGYGREQAALDRDQSRFLQQQQLDFSRLDREDQQEWNAWQSDLGRGFQERLTQIQNDHSLTMQERQALQERTMGYYQTILGREGLLAQQLAAIYGNGELSAEEQRAAADNARSFYTGLWESSNATFSNGIPSIFLNPYPQAGGPGSTNPSPGFPTLPGNGG